nr:MAG TPA: hypothetical protein [Caudoviricetes sp.]
MPPGVIYNFLLEKIYKTGQALLVICTRKVSGDKAGCHM